MKGDRAGPWWWPLPIPSHIPFLIRAAPFIAAMLLIGVCVAGLVSSKVDLVALINGDFQLALPPPEWLRPTVPSAAMLWRGLVLAGVLLVLYLFFQYVNTRLMRRRSTADGNSLASLGQRDLSGVKAEALSLAEAQFFSDCLVHPEARFLRIAESVEPNTRTVLVRSTFTVDARLSGAGRRLVVPLVLSTRGRLEDGIHFYNGTGDRISSLSHSESIDHVAAVIGVLIAKLGLRTRIRYRRRAHGLASVEERVRQSLSIKTALQSLSTREQEEQRAAVTGLVGAVLDLAPRKADQLYTVVELIQRFRWEYPICVLVEHPQSAIHPIRLSVERRVAVPIEETTIAQRVKQLFRYRDLGDAPPPQASTVPRLLAAVLGLLRELYGLVKQIARQLLWYLRHLFGIRSNVLSLAITNSARTFSYHLQVKGPDGFYVATQRIVNSNGREVPRSFLNTIDHQYSELVGQRNAHLHVRNGSEGAERLGYRVTFLERTPGSMARASLTALIATVLAIIIATVQLHGLTVACEEIPCAGTDPVMVTGDSGLIQVLLAFPLAIATASFGTGPSFWGGVLAARAANFATMTLSLIALGISAVPFRFTVDGLNQAWLGTCVLLGALAISCVASWWVRANIHASFVRSGRSD